MGEATGSAAAASRRDEVRCHAHHAARPTAARPATAKAAGNGDGADPEAAPSGMVAVLGMERGAVLALCDTCRGDGILQVANVLCPGNVVVSGTAGACGRLAAAATAAGAMKCVPLEVAGGFHTALMEPAVERLAAALADVSLEPPRIPVVSNVDARPHTDPDEIRRLLARQVVGVVEWSDSMAYILSTGVRSVWEVGPGRVLRGLMKRIDRSVACSGALD